ncbi:MAG: glycoside hydrolase family 28 protein [Clostridia bacterium]|nr:glycoside hydrolase family 28 protein [Clostridia bacterium]
MNFIAFDNEIVLYWDKEWQYPDGVRYEVAVNDQRFTTEKTHFRITELQPQTEYAITVERVATDGVPAGVLFSDTLCTGVAKKRLDITKAPYFAVGDNQTLNTNAIQKALNDCTADACVYIPAGVYLTGALDVHSDTEIFVDEGAVLQGTASVDDYAPKIASRFEGIETLCYRSLINIGKMESNGGYNCRNIVLRGGGSILGGGGDLACAVIERERGTDPNGDRTVLGRARNRLIQVNNTENVVIGNLTLGYSSAWNLHFLYSKKILTYGCKLYSKGVWNGDGWNPDSSEDCTIFDTEFEVGDDAIAIKSGKNPQGNIINRPTQNVRVFDCVCHCSHGLSIGSELSGGVKNVWIWDTDFVRSWCGIRVKTTRKRGGFVQNLRVRNCKLADVQITTGYTCNDDGDGSGELTRISDFYFENVTVYGVSHQEKTGAVCVPPIFIFGFAEKEYYIRNVCFNNVCIIEREDGEMQNISLKCVSDLHINGLHYKRKTGVEL